MVFTVVSEYVSCVATVPSFILKLNFSTALDCFRFDFNDRYQCFYAFIFMMLILL